MASILEENRARLQQRISQRLRGDLTQHRAIPRRRYLENDGHVDPFRLQAQEYIFDNKTLTERILQQVKYEQNDTMQLPMLKPRYTDLHPSKGVPAQDLCTELQVEEHEWQDCFTEKSMTIQSASKVTATQNYPKQMRINSHLEKSKNSQWASLLCDCGQELEPSENLRVDNCSELFYANGMTYLFSRKIVMIAPQRIQYQAIGAQDIHPAARILSPVQQRKEEVAITALKGKRMSTMSSNDELTSNASTSRAPRNLSFLHKLRKRLNSRDKKFVENITTQSFITEKRDKDSFSILSLKNRINPHQMAPLPPIRITVTNPLPENQPPEDLSFQEKSRDPENSIHLEIPDDKQKKLPLVKFSQPRKRKNTKKSKRKRQVNPKREDEALPDTLTDNLVEESQSGDINEEDKNNGSVSRKNLSQFDSLMPAPITKITFQSYNSANLRKPKKVVNNVQVERVMQKNVLATHPDILHRNKDPAVKVSTFEMVENPNPDIIYRKDGTLGPAPPSTNYVNFQKTTRQGGQSRALLSLRNRMLAADASDALNNWGAGGGGLLGIQNGPQGLLTDLSSSHRLNEGVSTHRKLGRIKAMKRSLLAAHKALFEETDGKIEIDAATDEGKSEKSYGSELAASISSIGKSYYINRISEIAYPQNQAQASGFYMGRSQDQPDITVSSTRTIGTQWNDKPPISFNTPLAPPNTAFLQKMQHD